MTSKQRAGRALSFLAFLAVLPAATAASEENPFLDLDLNEVLNLEITSVSKKPQTVSQAAAAVFVITGDDIRRSGANTVPDLLRMVPGVQVAQISRNTWAISARGMSGRFTNKLLVLVDGRSVYTPSFSGVFWDAQDLVLSDIERIEIIRGPGASLWGANAVNGVINILTKAAAATQGSLLEASTGTRETYAVAGRYGGRLGDIGHWRAYAKAFDRDASIVEATGGRGADDWKQQRAGFRADLAPSAKDAITVQGDFHKGYSGESATLNSLQAPFRLDVDARQRASGANLLARWQHDVSATDSFTLQSYVDHTQRDWPAHFRETRNTFDVDFQYRTRRFAGHDMVLGAGYRYSHAEARSSTSGVPEHVLQLAHFADSAARRHLYSLYFQDDITLVPRKLVLTLGSKLEHNDYSGFENQPNARLLWTPSESSTFWGSVSRAVRTPSSFDQDGEANLQVLAPLSADNPAPLPVLVASRGQAGSENVIAYELGWKQRVTPEISFDLALFHNDYRKLRTFRRLPPNCQPSGLPLTSGCFLFPDQTHILLGGVTGNEARARSTGAEFALDWRARRNLRFQFAWTALSMRFDAQDGILVSDGDHSAAKRQASLRMAWNPRPDVDVDLWLRHVGKLRDVDLFHSNVDAYNEADLRLAWRPRKDVELALVGRNLLHKRHEEFVSESGTTQHMLIERAFFGQVVWRF